MTNQEQSVKQAETDAKKLMSEHKEKFMKDNSTKSMVYENGAALGFIYRELNKLVNEVHQLKNIIQNGNNTDNKEH